MIKSYLTIALRNLWRHKSYTAINILGLAIGMACVILILLYVRAERNVDKFHVNGDSIYRLNLVTSNPQTGEVSKYAYGPYRLGQELPVDFPEINLVRFIAQDREGVLVGDVEYLEENLTFADENVFEVFSFDLIKGDHKTALGDPFSVVISESTARRYFGDQEGVGMNLEIRERDFVVTGIMKDIPDNSQFDFDLIVSMNCADQVFSRIVLENWGEMTSWTFIQLPATSSPESLDQRLKTFTDTKLTDWAKFSPTIMLQPLDRVYLYSTDVVGYFPGGDIVYVFAFSFIAIFILMIACINYINLATARSSLRSKEVGLRKVVGATGKQLFGQFMSESLLLSILALFIGIGLAAVALPYFNMLADKSMIMADITGSGMIFWLLGIAVFVGLVAGAYPALVLSGMQPIGSLTAKAGNALKGVSVRKGLVTFQFATSIFLLIVTAVVYRQLNYCHNMDVGFDKEHVVLIEGTPFEMRDKYDQFRTELMKSPQIINGAPSSRVPPGNLTSSLRTRPEGIPEDQQEGMQTVWTDFDFIETLGLDVLEGRSFSRSFPADATEGFVLNEAAVRQIGWTNSEAINKTFGSSEIRDWDAGQWVDRDGRVIGVLKDFHFESLKEDIVPTVYFVAPYMAWNYVIRIRPERVSETLKHIESTWLKFNPDVSFEYTFADENFAALYENEQRQGKIFAVFAFIAIFIACLGLVGLASFTADRKRKEMGVRKVLGATSFQLVMQLSREFTWLVLVAFVIAAPLAWYTMNGWLQDFAYRTPFGIWVFVVSGASAIVIAWITVGLQTARTAYQNPVEALRYE